MFYLISYDISDNKRRAKIAKLLEGFGQRVLESVFECDLNPRAYTVLRTRLNKRIRPTEGDQMRIYRMCANCIGNAEVIGSGLPLEQSPQVYII
jgi:CRISPR-associated protein Cas2